MSEQTVVTTARPARVGPGTQLNDLYEIDSLIAVGGMGEIYKGHVIETGDEVAIKTIRTDLAENPTALALFRKEASALRTVHHGAVVRYFVFAIDRRVALPYLAMEHVTGESLADRLKRGPLPFESVEILRRRLASGLQAAHEVGIIHRDVSPDNIVLPEGDPDRAKIIDFGIARSLVADQKTVIGSGFAGKYHYVSPEQLGLQGGDVTSKSDIYGLALVLAEAALGRRIDMGDSPAACVARRSKVPDLSGVDARLRPLLETMLAPDPAGRPESMAAVAAWRPAGSAPPRSEAPPPRQHRGWVYAVAGLAFALVLALGGLVTIVLRTGENDGGPPETGPLLQEQGGLDAPPAGSGTPTTSSPPPAQTPPPATSPPPTVRTEAIPPRPSPPVAEAPRAELPRPELPPAEIPRAMPRVEVPRAELPKIESPRVEPSRVEPVKPEPPRAEVPRGNGPRFDSLRVEPPRAEPSPPAIRPSAPMTDVREIPYRAPPAPDAGASVPDAPRREESSPTILASRVPPPTRLPPPIATPSPTAEDVAAYIRHYRGGSCFYLLPRLVASREADIEAFGSVTEPFRTFDTAFVAALGFQPQIQLRQIDRPQCPVVDALTRQTAQSGTPGPRLTIDRDRVRSGDEIRGSVEVTEGTEVELLRVDPDGTVHNLSDNLVPRPGRATFAARLEAGPTRQDQAQLIVAVTRRRRAAFLGDRLAARTDTVFEAIAAEAARPGSTLGLAVRYVKVGS